MSTLISNNMHKLLPYFHEIKVKIIGSTKEQEEKKNTPPPPSVYKDTG